MIVYKVIFPNNKIYIGITTKSLASRQKEHYRRMNSSVDWKFYNALRKYKGLETWEVLNCSATSWEELCKLERYYISEFDSCNNGYNCTSGGDGNFNPSKEVLEKMSAWQKGKKLTKEHREKLSLAKMGRKNGPQTVQWRLNIGIGRGAKPFKMFDKNTGALLGVFQNYSDGARFLNGWSIGISRCLRYPDRFKSYKGCTFEYLPGGDLS